MFYAGLTSDAFCVLGKHKGVFVSWARTQEQRALAEHDWVTDPALSPLSRQGAHRDLVLWSSRDSDLCSAVRPRATAAGSCLTVCSATRRSSPDLKPTFRSAIDSQPPADRSDVLTHPLLHSREPFEDAPTKPYDCQQQRLVGEDWRAS
jgi:hypothetical protein